LYEARDFGPAATRYAMAAQSLSEPMLRARARMGEALSYLQSGEELRGKPLLVKLADDPAQPDPIRAEARYHLAALAVGAGAYDAASEELDKLMQLESAGIWAMQISLLRSQLSSIRPGMPVP